MGPINGGPINLKSALLQDAMLRFATLSTAELEDADLSRADLVHARLDQANLRSANLSCSQLDHASFVEANLANANLCGASLSFANLTAADLEAADMRGADFAHARFDNANLRDTNLSSAFLEHANFVGANLAKANLSGANLYHAKNLTETQLEETILSNSTILPANLSGSVAWSMATVADTPTLEPLERRSRDRGVSAPDGFRASGYGRPVWIAGMCLVCGVFITTGFVLRRINEPLPLATSDAQTGAVQSSGESKLSSIPDKEKLPLSAAQEKASGDGSADAVTPPMPPAASTGDRTESVKVPPADTSAVQEPNDHAELQASDNAKGPGEAVGTEEHAIKSFPGPEADDKEGPESSPVIAGEALAPRHGTVPEVPTQAAISNPQSTPTKEAPAGTLALNSPEQLVAPPLSDTAPPPVATPALPSFEAAEPHEASPPMPARKPSIQKRDASKPDPAETAKAVKKPRDVSSKPDTGRTISQKTVQKAVSGWVADLLAGGF